MFSSERLKGIDVFVCVADSGSFTIASERLNITTSAVSKAISRLEKRLNVLLFNRTTRRIALTEAGIEFYRTCTQVISQLEDVENALHDNGLPFKGRVRVNLPATYGRVHALPSILNFFSQHPQLEPQIILTDCFIDPVEENFDITIRSGGTGIWPNDLSYHLLGMQRLIFCASKKYLDEHGTPANEEELIKHCVTLYVRPDGFIYPLHFSNSDQGNALRPVFGNLSINDSEGQAIAVIAGHGIAQLPLWLAKKHLQTGDLVHILPDLDAYGLPINLVWLKKKEYQPKIKALVDYLKEDLDFEKRGWGYR